MGVLPECLKVFLGKIQILKLLVQVSQKISGKISFLGVLPQIIISTLGVLPFKAFWELYISSNHVLISSGITPGDLSGSNISNLYIFSILIPV